MYFYLSHFWHHLSECNNRRESYTDICNTLRRILLRSEEISRASQKWKRRRTREKCSSREATAHEDENISDVSSSSFPLSHESTPRLPIIESRRIRRCRRVELDRKILIDISCLSTSQDTSHFHLFFIYSLYYSLLFKESIRDIV